jgi:hypothetical protein
VRGNFLYRKSIVSRSYLRRGTVAASASLCVISRRWTKTGDQTAGSRQVIRRPQAANWCRLTSDRPASASAATQRQQQIHADASQQLAACVSRSAAFRIFFRSLGFSLRSLKYGCCCCCCCCRRRRRFAERFLRRLVACTALLRSFSRFSPSIRWLDCMIPIGLFMEADESIKLSRMPQENLSIERRLSTKDSLEVLCVWRRARVCNELQPMASEGTYSIKKYCCAMRTKSNRLETAME